MIHESMDRRVMKRVAAIAPGVIIAAMLGAALTACEGKQQPPAPQPAPSPVVQTPEPEADPSHTEQPHGEHTEQPAAESPAPPVVPTIPDHLLSGMLGGEPFLLRRADRMGSALRLAGEGDYAVTLVFFNEPDRRSWTILEPAAFGAPHLHVRTPGAVAVVMEGYRMLLELDESGQRGGIWLELPEDRGTIAGRFAVMSTP